MQDSSFNPVEPLIRGRAPQCVCSGSKVITLLTLLLGLGCAFQLSLNSRGRRMSTQQLTSQETVFAAASASRPVELGRISGLQSFALPRRPWPVHSNFGGHITNPRPFGKQGIDLELAAQVCMPLFASSPTAQDLVAPSGMSDVTSRRGVGFTCALLFPALAASLPAFAACDFNACVKECSRLISAGNEAYCEAQCADCTKANEEKSSTAAKSDPASEKTSDAPAPPRRKGPPTWGNKESKGSFNGNGGFLPGR